MISNSFYSQDVHGPYESYDVGNLDLEEGGTIRECKLAYATFGTLNAAKDNAILDSYLVLRNQQDHGAGVYRARDARSIPTNISSLSSIRSATASPARRTTPRHRPGWEIFRTSASATMCVRSTSW